MLRGSFDSRCFRVVLRPQCHGRDSSGESGVAKALWAAQLFLKIQVGFCGNQVRQLCSVSFTLVECSSAPTVVRWAAQSKSFSPYSFASRRHYIVLTASASTEENHLEWWVAKVLKSSLNFLGNLWKSQNLIFGYLIFGLVRRELINVNTCIWSKMFIWHQNLLFR